MGIFSRVGIGSATVDTILPDEPVQPGDTVEATVEIEGGDSDQDIEEIEFALATEYAVDHERRDEYETVILHEQEITGGFTIEAGESRTEAVELHIHRLTPVTMGNSEVWIDTGLEIDWAKDPTDRDQLSVEPGPYLQATLDALEALGFETDTVDCISGTGPSPFPFVQEFDMAPTSGPYHGAIEEIDFYQRNMEEAGIWGSFEIEFSRTVTPPSADQFDWEVDLSQVGDVDGDEAMVGWHVDTTDSERVRDRLAQVLDHYV